MSAMTMTMTAFNDNASVTRRTGDNPYFEIGRRMAAAQATPQLGDLRILVEVGALVNNTVLRMYGDDLVFNIPALGTTYAAHTITIPLGAFTPGTQPVTANAGFANIVNGTDYRGTGFPQRAFRYSPHNSLRNAGVVSAFTVNSGAGSIVAGGKANQVGYTGATPTSLNYIQFLPDSQHDNTMLFEIIISNTALITSSISGTGAGGINMSTNAGLQSIADRINLATNRNGTLNNQGLYLFTDNANPMNTDERPALYAWRGVEVVGANQDLISRSDQLIYSSLGGPVGGNSSSNNPYWSTTPAILNDIWGISLWGGGHGEMRPYLLNLMRSGADIHVDVEVFSTPGTTRARELRLVGVRDKHNYRNRMTATTGDFPGVSSAFFDGNIAYNNNYGGGSPVTGGWRNAGLMTRPVTAAGNVKFVFENKDIWNADTEEFLWDVLYLEKWFDNATGTATANWQKTNNTDFMQLDGWVITAVLPADKVLIGDGGGGPNDGSGTNEAIISFKKDSVTWDDVSILAGLAK
jgi:hypothetical protein